MLNPCSPCVCTGAPCEQCTFGYRSREDNHERMKKLLLAYEAGEKPVGWKNAETYQLYHSNWRDELGECEKPAKPDFVSDEEKETLKVKIIAAFSCQELEEKVNEFINRDYVGQIHTVQFSGNSVLIMYDECDPTTPEKFFDF